MSPFAIRGAITSDLTDIEGVFGRASLSNSADREALLAHPEVLRLHDDFLTRSRVIVAATTEGKLVGFASTRPTLAGTLELDDLFVDPPWMRHGVARSLIQAITAQAAADGATRIEVTGNQHALEFYRSVGFVEDGMADTQFGPGLRLHLEVPPT